MIKRSCQIGEIKHLKCKQCKNRAGCRLKYSGIYVHDDVPEICLVNHYLDINSKQRFEKEGV